MFIYEGEQHFLASYQIPMVGVYVVFAKCSLAIVFLSLKITQAYV